MAARGLRAERDRCDGRLTRASPFSARYRAYPADGSRATKRARIIRDVSEGYVQGLLALPVDWGSPASAASLGDLLQAPLTGLKLFLPPGNDGLERAAAGVFSFADLPEDESMEKLLAVLQCAALHDLNPLGKEEDVATVAYELTGQVWTTLDTLCSRLRLTSARNSANPSGATIQSARPDYCLWASGRLLLKAEHKLDDGGLDAAKHELAAKLMDWSLPGLRELPFLPCYAVGGRFLQFCVLRRVPGAPMLTERVDIGPAFRMDSADRRLRIVAASFNVYRLLARLMEMLPEKAPQLYGSHERPTGVVELLGAHVVKSCSQFAADDVYALLKSGSVPNTIKLVSYKRSGEKMRLEERPVCVQRLPETEPELAAAVKAVLEALAAFHARGFVHRDVRWPNVLLAYGDSWLLTDFELAARAGSLVPEGAISADYLPPEVASAPTTAPYTPAGDIFCVGRLLATSAVALGDAASELAAQLSAAVPAERPSAQQALLCSWLHCASAAGGAAGGGGGAAGAL